MKKHLYPIFAMLLLAFSVSACNDDGPAGKDEPGSSLPIASTAFGQTRKAIEAAETAAGRTVERYDDATRTLIVQTGLADFPSIRYYFDQAENYRYALVYAASFDLFATEHFAELLRNGLWEAYDAAPSDDRDESVYRCDGVLLRIFLRAGNRQASPAMLVGKLDESALSWTRLDPHTDPTTGMRLPLVAWGGSADLIAKYELLHGHTLNAGRTDPDKAFVAYDTGDDRFPMMGYWLDLETGTFLEECALYVDPESRPGPAEADAYVTALGFSETGLKDGNGNFLYYDAASTTVCLVEMNRPETGVFSPKLRFYTQDLTDELPKSSVTVPWPNMQFGAITMDEARDWYETLGYALSVHPELGIPQATTDSADFPAILLLEDGGFYAGAYLLTPDVRVITSPDLVRQLLEQGFVAVEGFFLATFRNTDTNVEVQIDTSAMFGAYGVGFNLIGA